MIEFKKRVIKYRLLVQGREVARGSMKNIANKAVEWSKSIIDVRVEPVRRRA